MKLFLVAFSLLVAGLFGLSDASNFDRINAHLTKELRINDIEANMDSARKLLKREVNSCFPLKYHFVRDLETFLSLGSIKDLDNKCDRRAYEILHNVGEATGVRGYSPLRNLGLLSRVNYIVNKLSMDHYELCKDVYPVTFAAKYAQLNGIELTFIDEWAKTLHRQSWPYASDRTQDLYQLESSIYSALIHREDLDMAKLRSEGPILLEKLAKKANDPDVVYARMRRGTDKLPIIEKEIRSLINKYLLLPCKHYADELGLDVFLPWEYDLLMVDPSKRFDAFGVARDSRKELRDAYIGFIKFGMCKTILANEAGVISAILDELKWLSYKNYKNRVRTISKPD